MPNKGMDLYEFGPFHLDPVKRVLLRDNLPIPLQLKAFETLLVLVRHSEQVVLKEDLMRAVWPNTFVEEGNLTQNIFMLRKTLGSADGEQRERYIDTIPGRGYRFAAKVRLVSAETEAASQSPPPTEAMGANVYSHPVDEVVPGKSSRTLQRAIAACALVLLLALAVFLLRPTIPPPRVTRIRPNYASRHAGAQHAIDHGWSAHLLPRLGRERASSSSRFHGRRASFFSGKSHPSFRYLRYFFQRVGVSGNQRG